MRALVALFLIGCAGAPVPATPPVVRPIDNMIAHTMQLSDPGCTGVRIGGGKVVTAQHCVEDKYAVGDKYTGLTVEYISDKYDFAVLGGDTAQSPVPLVDAVVGERVYVVGYPVSIDDEEQYLTVTDGVYTGVVADYMQRITAYAYYGNSGGGAWNSSGELVGILVEIRPVGEGQYGIFPMPAHSYMVPAKLVRDVL